MEGNQSNTKDLGSLTIKDMFFKYIRFLPVFLVSVAICLLAAYLYLRWTTPIYRVSGTITFKTEDNGRRGDKFEDIFNAKNVNDIQTEIEILKSRPLMERVVDLAKLQTSYYAVGKIKTLNIYKSCPFRLDIIKINDTLNPFNLDLAFINENEFRINKESNRFKIGDLFQNSYGIFRIIRIVSGASGKEYKIDWKPTPVQATSYAPMIRVSPKIVGSNIYNIQIDYTNSQLGADIVNNVMTAYLQASIEDKNVTINQRLDYIQQQLLKFEQDLDSVENKIINFRRDNDITDVEQQTSTYFTIIKDADNNVNEQQVQLQVLDILAEYLRNDSNKNQSVPSSLGLKDLTLNQLVDTYNRLQTDIKTLLESHIPEGNIQVQSKYAELQKAKDDIQEMMTGLKKSYQAVIDNFYKRGISAQGKVKQMPEKLQRLLEMERERDSKLALYKFLQEQREETAMSQASTISNSKILDLAQPTTVPIMPNRRGIQLLAIILEIGRASCRERV